MAALALPGCLTTESHHVDVETRGELTRGMMVVDSRPRPAGAANVQLATGAAIGEVRQYIERILKQAALTRGKDLGSTLAIIILFASGQAPGLDALSKNVRALVLKNLPDPVVQSSPGWGNQKETAVGVKYHRDGFKLWTEVLKAPRNDGTWRRMSVRAVDPDRTLALTLTGLTSPKPGRVTFSAMAGVDCDLKFEQQVWKGGTRLYSGETRGRCRGALLLKCEATTRLEPKPGGMVPGRRLPPAHDRGPGLLRQAGGRAHRRHRR